MASSPQANRSFHLGQRFIPATFDQGHQQPKLKVSFEDSVKNAYKVYGQVRRSSLLPLHDRMQQARKQQAGDIARSYRTPCPHSTCHQNLVKSEPKRPILSASEQLAGDISRSSHYPTCTHTDESLSLKKPASLPPKELISANEQQARDTLRSYYSPACTHTDESQVLRNAASLLLKTRKLSALEQRASDHAKAYPTSSGRNCWSRIALSGENNTKFPPLS